MIDSTAPFVYTACCAHLDALNPAAPASVLAIRPRERDFHLFCVATEEGTVRFRGTAIDYRIRATEPLPTDGKPEPHRRLELTARAEREVLLDFVRLAVSDHQARMTAPRGRPGAGVMRHVWDEDAECWDGGRLVAHRALDTLYLQPHVAEDALSDLRTYLCHETAERYAALHLAPVRSYMLYGPPGSGKSAMMHCLASETGHNLAVINFKEHTSDQDIVRAVRNLPPRTFLCIEDIDCLFDMRAKKNHGVSFASLLSALDGAFDSSHGSSLTVFMTTNHLEHLDQALRRRVDCAVEFTHATRQQCRLMFEAFYPGHDGFEALWAELKHHTFSMSVVQKFLVRTLQRDDPLSCMDMFHSLIQCTYGGERTGAMYA